MMRHATEESAPFVLVLTRDDAGFNGFPADLLPNGRVLIKDFPFDRLGGICPGEVVVIPESARQPTQRVRPIGTRALRVAGAETVTAVVTLEHPVADIPLPQSLQSEEALRDMITRHNGDILTGLRSAGMTVRPLAPEALAALRPKAPRPTCTPPEVRDGDAVIDTSFSICDWLGIFC
jgi:hypothetical protein